MDFFASSSDQQGILLKSSLDIMVNLSNFSFPSSESQNFVKNSRKVKALSKLIENSSIANLMDCAGFCFSKNRRAKSILKYFCRNNKSGCFSARFKHALINLDIQL